MQEALPYKAWLPIPQASTNLFRQASPSNGSIISPKGDVKSTVSENAVVVLCRRGCCMSHVAKRLLQSLGANPGICEVDEDDEDGVVKELSNIAGDDQDQRLQFPAVFIGGKLFGGLDRIMAAHITGELVPILKRAGALWL
ncbi:Thioredoxin-disulfide reductase [Bertholletia excelsa]